MLENAWTTTNTYMRFYYQFVAKQWDTMDPTDYACILMGIAFFGWLLMKSSLK